VRVWSGFFLVSLLGFTPAWSQFGCTGQLRPLKPLTPIGCSDTMPVCNCTQGGQCGWVWVCAPRATPQGIDPSIPLQFRSPQTTNFLDTLLQVQQLRLLQQQKALQEQQLRQMKAEQSEPPTAVNSEPIVTSDLLNCRAWRGMSEATQLTYVFGSREASIVTSLEIAPSADLGKYSPMNMSVKGIQAAITQICGEPENSGMPLPFVVRLVAMKDHGDSAEEIHAKADFYRKITENISRPTSASTPKR